VQYYELPFRVRAKRLIASDDDGEELNWSLREFYDRMEGDKPDIMIGWLPNEYASTFTFGGLAETVMSGQVARVALAVDYKTDYSSMHVLPHEVGHDLGLDHTGTTGDSSSDCRVSKSRGSYWPAQYGNSAAIQEVGFDTTDMKVIPGSFYDLMAYCSEQKTWLSTFHYKKLFDQDLRPQGYFDTTRGHKAWVRGWAAFKGDAARIELVSPPGSGSGSGTSPQAGAYPIERAYSPMLANSVFLPLTAGRMGTSGQAIEREGEGNHCLQFMDAADALLYERCFDLTFRSAETSEPLEGSGFVLGVPDTAGVARVVLVRNEGGQTQELTSLDASSQAPTLNITSPKSGDRWTGEHTITWSATDADSDASSLRYDIQYSPDGKKSWYPLEVGSHESAYTFSTDEILPGDQTYIRVLASDGFNTTSADVGPLVVPQQPNSPKPPPGPVTDGVTSQGTDTVRPGGLPYWSMIAIVSGIAGVGLLIMVGFAFSRSRRRTQVVPATAASARADLPAEAPSTHAYTQPMTVQPTMPTPPATAYYQQPPPQPQQPPPPQPTQPAYYPAAPNPFQAAQMQYGQWQAELASGRITRQQYEAAVNSIRVQDQQGRYWMLGAYDGAWYFYDGRSWVRTNLPH
ncbi:MAG: hypothetical protein M3328_01490, partial [Chloroflexota bacterium]|nr:hypothetical protein [Chloroflexota bacterium]